MVKIKYSGKGMSSKGIQFSPTINNGLFEVSDEDSKYFLETFPNQFALIEKIEPEKVEKKPRVARNKKKSTDVEG